MYVRELYVRYRTRRIAGQPTHMGSLTTSKDAAHLLSRLIGHEAVEVCGILCLTTGNQMIAYHELSRGTLDTSIVHPRDVFRTALLSNARSVVIGHNHPSGDAQPSMEDVILTRRLAAAGELIGIDVSDHIIVGSNGSYFSFRDASRL